MKDLKKRLHKYVETHRKKGYSLAQIRKGLVVYGFEPSYAEKVISSYRIKTTLHVMLFLIVVLGLPLLARPVVTGYFFLSPFGDGIGDYFGAVDYVILLGLLVVLAPALVMVFKLRLKDKLSTTGFIEMRFFRDTLRTFFNRLGAGFDFFRRKIILPKPDLKVNEEGEREYKENNPIILLYNSILIVSVAVILAGVIFRLWMLVFFSVVAIVFAVIGKTNVKKMYFKEVE